MTRRGRRQVLTMVGAAALLGSAPSHLRAEEPLALSLPLDCEMGRTCFVQNYADMDPGPGVKDYACQAATYNGHDGTDFRVLSTAASETAVLAAAPGLVKGARDGMTDQFVADGGRESIRGRECGNGLVIDHGGGWETQYCHLRKGSLAVKRGDPVARGQRLGSVGFSGLVDFPHVHVSVRYAGKAVDPFLYPPGPGPCAINPTMAAGLWDAAARSALAYRDGVLIWTGFSEKPLSNGELERGIAPPLPTRASPQMLFVARAMNVRAGDQMRLTITGPKGEVAKTTMQPFDRHMAVSMTYIGAKVRGTEPPSGTYDGVAEVLRGGVVISTLTSKFEFRD